MLRRLPLALLLLAPLAAHAQDTTLHGLNLTGSPPANFADNPLRFACLSSTYCWPLMTIWDGTTKATVNSGDNGLNTHIANSPTVTVSNTNANGQTTMSASSPVAIASDQSAVATKAAASTFVAGSIVDLAHGQGTMAASVPVALASDQSAVPVSPAPYPATAVPITASATGTTAATTATLTNVSTHLTYICGFSIRANATAAVTGNATVTGVKTATMNFTQWTAPAASGLGVTEEVFSPCIPASAVSTSISVISAAPGTGGVVSVTAWGYSI